VPLAHRVQQLELAMERLRWLRHPAGRMIVVNIPTFRLWAVDAEEVAPAVALEMGVVVGRAPVTKTPVFEAALTHVVFRPYWNVPRSILRSELLPLIRRRPAYVHEHAYEIVAGEGDDARVVSVSAEAIAGLAAGTLRLRQRPGPGNALGLVKFVFPNRFDVFMHGTPATALFARSRRDFSHGCVRLERPADLAAWALAELPDWNEAAVAAAMNGVDNRRVDLRRPVRVMMFYVTALVVPATNDVLFAADLYGHDERLARALGALEARQ
jgi:murein L,D-transpeptidase YcbB/YkuD